MPQMTGFEVLAWLRQRSEWNGLPVVILTGSCYELDVTLVTPRDHPLARRRRVRVRDLKSYPLVNAPASFADPPGAAARRLARPAAALRGG